MPDHGSTDRVRRFASEYFVKPARLRGEKTLTIHSGNLERLLVERKLLQPNRYPIVCNALRSKKFAAENHLRSLKIESPAASGQSSTVSFSFVLDAEADKSPLQDPPHPGFNDLYGLLKDTYRKLGGASSFHENEREEWGK